jgi:hypothetical protein
MHLRGLHQEVKCLNNIHYVLMPKLVELEIGLRSCYKISLSDLFEAAPNLRTLRFTGCECHDVLKDSVEDDDDGRRDDDSLQVEFEMVRISEHHQ